MKIGKVKRVIKNVPKPIVIKGWPKEKPIPIEIPKRKETVTK